MIGAVDLGVIMNGKVGFQLCNMCSISNFLKRCMVEKRTMWSNAYKFDSKSGAIKETTTCWLQVSKMAHHY
jgi:hypothetical protein